jgi:multiple sugar transport system permease protein
MRCPAPHRRRRSVASRVAVAVPAGRSRTLTALSFLTPFLVVYLAFVVYPVFSAARMSLYDWDLLGFTREFIGLENYRRMLWGTGMTWDPVSSPLLRLPVLAVTGWFAYKALHRGDSWLRVLPGVLAGLLLFAVLGIHPGADGAWNDPGFWISVEHTLEFTFISTPILVGLGLAMAMALGGKHRGGSFYRAAFFLPYVLPVSAVTLVWSFLLNPDRGLVARVLGWVGIEPITWLGNADLAMWGIVMTTVWWSVGFNLVLFLAGLQDIDPHLYEAAKLDGAGAWNRFRHVTVPGPDADHRAGAGHPADRVVPGLRPGLHHDRGRARHLDPRADPAHLRSRLPGPAARLRRGRLAVPLRRHGPGLRRAVPHLEQDRLMSTAMTTATVTARPVQRPGLPGTLARAAAPPERLPPVHGRRGLPLAGADPVDDRDGAHPQRRAAPRLRRLLPRASPSATSPTPSPAATCRAGSSTA